MKKCIKAVELEIKAAQQNIKEPLSVEDILRDKVIEQAFPNIRRLMVLYILDSAHRGCH